MTLEVIAAITFGLVLLTFGAEYLVRGASQIAAVCGVSSLVIGLTIVAFGTSAPEMAVSVKSAMIGQSDIALGNVVGSNIFNVLAILGACALIVPLNVHAQLIRWDVPAMIGVSFLSWWFCLDGVVSRIEGGVLIALLVGYTVRSIFSGRKEGNAGAQNLDPDFSSADALKASKLPLQVAFVIGGLVVLVIGARLFIFGAVEVARSLGVSELVIGLTLVAAGTSLPEVATSIMASIKGERDIAIGNVVGSNIFNLLAVLGVSATVTPVGVSPQALAFDIPVMVGVAVVCLPVFLSGKRVSRIEGVFFLLAYCAYTFILILDASGGK